MLIGKDKKQKKNKNVRKFRPRNSSNNIKPREYSNDYREEKKPVNKKLRFKLNILFTSLIILPICVLLLSRYTKTTELLMETTIINKEIEELNDKKGKLELELEEIKDSGWIEEQAKVRMNMKKAKSDQIIFIDVE